ncbi:peptidoglycan-binding protein [Streptomyces sp. NPDC050560]|uniref:peptidoglycan-binding domain-containing protein n=1 Tax=Streptomyces sp. NPDC050560 TaxID=3365630 RepID=UPI0037A2E42D
MVTVVSVLAVPVVLLGAVRIAEDAFDHAGPERPTGLPSLMLPTGTGHSAATPSDAASSPASGPTSPAPTAAPSPGASTPPATGRAPDRPPPGSTDSTGPRDASPGSPADAADGGAPVLRQGMSGPEVTLLQQRLRRVGGLYEDEPDGVYDAGVTEAVATFQRWRAVKGDPEGVYGPHSRAQLEAETPGTA